MSEPNAVEIANANARIERDQLKVEVASLKAQLDATKKALKEALDKIEQDERAKMIPTILVNTKLTKEEVNAMDTQSLFALTETFRLMRTPIAGVQPSAEEAINSRLTVGDAFAYADKRRK